MKILCGVILALCLMVCVLCLSAVPARAEIVDSGTCGDDLTWTLDDAGLLTISGTGAMANYSDSCDSPFHGDILTVVIEDGVTSIGDHAFHFREHITSVELPESLTAIGEYAFYECLSLGSVAIPGSVTRIGEMAFYECLSLQSVTIPVSVKDILPSAFGCCDSLNDVWYGGTEEQWNAITIEDGNDPLLRAEIHYDFTGGPIITEQPASATAATGSKATFTVAATGTGTLSYQWQYSADGMCWNNTALSGYNTTTLTVTAGSAMNGRYYRCIVTDSKGSTASRAAKLTVVTLTAPKGLTAANNLTTGRVKLSWKASSGAAGYNIYRSKSVDGTYEKLNAAPVTDLTYTDGRSGNAGVTYWYKVTAVCDFGESAPTAAVPRIAKCQRPANLKATANSDGSVTLTWDAPLVKSSVSGYRVYLWDAARGAFQWINGSLKADGSATAVTIPAGALGEYKGKIVRFSLRGYNSKDILGTISIYAAPASAAVK